MKAPVSENSPRPEQVVKVVFTPQKDARLGTKRLLHLVERVRHTSMSKGGFNIDLFAAHNVDNCNTHGYLIACYLTLLLNYYRIEVPQNSRTELSEAQNMLNTCLRCTRVRANHLPYKPICGMAECGVASKAQLEQVRQPTSVSHTNDNNRS